MNPRPWTVRATGLELAVRLTAKGGRDAIEGIEALADGRTILKARVRAAPSKGDANRALEWLIARSLGVAVSLVSVTAGASSRIKRVRIAGNGAVLAGSLQQLD